MAFKPTKPFSLPKLPPSIKQENVDTSLLLEARSTLAHLKGVCQAIEHPNILLLMPMLQESLKSCEIEGIRTTIEAALENQIELHKNKKDPQAKEALLYKNAIEKGLDSMKRYSLSTRTIRSIHRELMPKGRGAFRGQQNTIVDGKGNIIYTPPKFANINPLINNWENYVNASKSKLDPLIRAAVCHYQFEAIHPFSDGNGRTGRILMILQMVQDQLLDHPVLYLSGYINKERPRYYELLRSVTEQKNWKEYISFVLEAVAKQAKITTDIVLTIKNTKTSFKRKLRDKQRTIYNSELLDHLFLYPVTYPSFMSSDLGIVYQTASKYLAALKKDRFLESKKVGKKILYYNMHLINCLKSHQ